jgi:peptidoglycan lytic transglycosylase
MNCFALKAVGFWVVLAVVTTAAGAERTARTHHPAPAKHAAKGIQVGQASYYGKGLQGKETASGEIFDKNDMVAAHPHYPLGTRVRVTNLRNGRTQDVRIIDRGPTQWNRKKGVIIDVSEQTAVQLGFRHKGKTRVRTEVLEWGQKTEK